LLVAPTPDRRKSAAIYARFLAAVNSAALLEHKRAVSGRYMCLKSLAPGLADRREADKLLHHEAA